MELERQVGGNFLLRLSSDPRPIANKYREGKVGKNFGKRVKSA